MSLYDSILTRILSQIVHEQSRYWKLFEPEELASISSYLQLTTDARYLFVRLYMRQDCWIRAGAGFRALADRYAEISNINSAISQLEKLEFLMTTADFDLELPHALDMLGLDELKVFAGRYCKSLKSFKKADMIQVILNAAKSQRSVFGTSLQGLIMKDVKRALGPVVRLSSYGRELVQSCIVACLCPRFWEDAALTNDILGQINMRKYASYEIWVNGDLFRDRCDLWAYVNSLKLENELQELMTEKRYDDALLIYQMVYTAWQPSIHTACNDALDSRCGFLLCYTSTHIHVRILSQCLLLLSRMKMYSLEQDLVVSLLGQPIFCQNQRGKWWIRLILLMIRYYPKLEKSISSPSKNDPIRYLDVISICKQALGDPSVKAASRRKIETYLRMAHDKASTNVMTIGEAEQDDFMRTSLENIPKTFISGHQVKTYGNEGKSRWVTLDDDTVSVEEFALLSYQKEGWDGIHVEGAIFSSIFALLFWDIIFSKQVNVFVHPFQLAPLDVDSDEFYSKRKMEIDERLKHIYDRKLAIAILYETYGREYQRICTGMNWQLELTLLRSIVEMLESRSLVKLMEYYCREHRNARSGLPDLTLWHLETCRLKLVEVKGPGDTLMDNQKVWLDKLSGDIGIEVEICLVKNVS